MSRVFVFCHRFPALLMVVLLVSLLGLSCKKKQEQTVAISTTPVIVQKAVKIPGDIVYVSKQNNSFFLRSYNYATKSSENLLSWNGEIKMPAWSPDGNRLVFFGQDKGKWHLYIMDKVQKKPIPLTLEEDLSPKAPPQWSADSNQIAFLYQGIWLINHDGTNPRTLIADESVKELAWSFDGSKIAFTRLNDHETNIWTIQPDGTNLIKITNNNECRNPSWSPDSQKLAFTLINKQAKNIWVIGGNGSDLHPLTYNNQSYAPAWSPDGSKITYLYGVFTTPSLWVMSVDGTGATPLSDSLALHIPEPLAWSPSWACDGSQIVFVMGSLATPNIFTIDAAGRQPKQISQDYGMDPTWSFVLSNETAGKISNIPVTALPQTVITPTKTVMPKLTPKKESQKK